MTLCIAWRDNEGTIHLASDSRVTVGTNSWEDVAVKITRIPCEIFPPSSKLVAGTGITRLSLGMAFAGSHLNAYVIKESLVEVLSRLQYIPGVTKISVENLCKIAFHAYQKLSRKICATVIGKKGICELFIAGYCPDEKRARAFRFSTDPTSNTHSMTEILLPGGPAVELTGSGRNAPSLQNKLHIDPLHALKDVIDDTSRTDVGGSLQYGIVSDHDFKIFCEYSFDATGMPTYMRAGLDLNGMIGDSDHEDLCIAPLVYDHRAT